MDLLSGGTTTTVQSNAGSLTLADGVASNFSDGPKTLALQGAGNGTISGPIPLAIPISKAGTGTWTLSHATNANFSATVSSGLLEVGANGALGTGNVNVLSTATNLAIDTGVTAPLNGNGYIYVTYGNGTFLVQESGLSQMVSTDGLVWTTASPGVPQNIPGIGTLPLATRFGRFLNGQFISVGGGSAGFDLYSSPDAQTRTSFGTVATSSDYIRDIASGGGHYVAICPESIFVTDAGGYDARGQAGRLGGGVQRRQG